jgi:RNA polymerase sigma factor (sigma-70 family)
MRYANEDRHTPPADPEPAAATVLSDDDNQPSNCAKEGCTMQLQISGEIGGGYWHDIGESGGSDRNSIGNFSDSQTRRTLLERLAQSGDQRQAAWAEFVGRYGRKIYGWCLRWRLQDADAQDVTQIVLLKLARRMKDFTYDPARSFRAWLKTVTHHAWQDYVDSRKTTTLAIGGGPAQDVLESLIARDDLSSALERLFDLDLLETAMRRVRLRAAPHTWTAFSMTAVEGIPAPEVARRLGMKIARVYAARNTIQQRLQAECRRLEGAQGPW